MRRIITAALSAAMLLLFIAMDTRDAGVSKTLPSDGQGEYAGGSTPTLESSDAPYEVRWIINEDGVAETQYIYSLPEDGSLPDYITDIVYADGSTPALESSDAPNEVRWITNEDGIAGTESTFCPPEDGSLPDYITDNNGDSIGFDGNSQDDGPVGQSIIDQSISLPLGREYSCAVNSPGDTDITVSMVIRNAVKSIDVYTPAGEMYESLSYIAPDAPYTIKNTQSGEWLIKIVNYSAAELADMAYEQGDKMAYSANYDFPPTEIQLEVTAVPTSVDVDVPSITNNPNILVEFFHDGNIVLTEDGKTLEPITASLTDGVHEISAVREIDGMRSEKADYTIEIDTVAPEMISLDVPSSTSRDRFLLQAEFSENVAGVSVNGEYFELGGCGGASSRYVEAFMLEPGINDFSLTITDYAGNSSYKSFSVERL